MEINECIFDSNPSTGTGVIHGRQFVNILIIESIFTNNSAIAASMVSIGVTTKLTVHSSKFIRASSTRTRDPVYFMDINKGL